MDTLETPVFAERDLVSRAEVERRLTSVGA